jgi:hypothetical protein
MHVVKGDSTGAKSRLTAGREGCGATAGEAGVAGVAEKAADVKPFEERRVSRAGLLLSWFHSTSVTMGVKPFLAAATLDVGFGFAASALVVRTKLVRESTRSWTTAPRRVSSRVVSARLMPRGFLDTTMCS